MMPEMIAQIRSWLDEPAMPIQHKHLHVFLLFYLYHPTDLLVFVGGKMMITDIYKIPIGASLFVVLTLLVAAVVLSLIFPNPKPTLAAISGTIETAHV